MIRLVLDFSPSREVCKRAPRDISLRASRDPLNYETRR